MSGEGKLRSLAKGWCWSTVRESLRNLDNARRPVKAGDRVERIGEYPYYGASGVIDSIDGYLFDGSFLLVGEDGANLVSRSKPIAFQAHGKFWVNNHAHVLKTHGDMPLGYFEGYFNSIDLAPYITGTAQPKLPQAAMNKIPVPIAPCPEQRRIVDAIESYFTRLDDAVATLERVERNLKRYRASVLKSAVEGRLVPTEAALAKQEGRTYEPASVLLERILTERRRRWSESGKKGKYQEPPSPDTANLPKLPEGWCWTTMNALLSQPLRNGHSAVASTDGQGVRTLTLTAVTVGNFSEENTKLTVADPGKVEDLWLERGDLLIERSNTAELVGTARLYRGESSTAGPKSSKGAPLLDPRAG